MAFLKLKKAFHMDKPLSIQLLTAPLDVVAEMNDFDTMEYKFKAKNVGSDFETKEKGSFAIRNNQEFDFVISEALYKSVSLYDKDSMIKIVMKKTKESKAGFVWDVQPMSADNVVQESKKSSDTSLDIKWGMAFNNATRLVSSEKLHEETDINDKVALVEMIMPKMFKIACSMPDKSDDDLPF
ncbi:MAG: hypothetical protein Unbinned202contig1002_33 [Prokaryotic dsDNA virus sp.]|nr:MAG: hypothetical protein Unbinned202contig1002_33 [Prokaryotic dsDNA virus sp.]|tara:strand:+ start:14354 stop:14902 length:549 start_codon:yes stop_codon:yes gene_type:complete